MLFSLTYLLFLQLINLLPNIKPQSLLGAVNKLQGLKQIHKNMDNTFALGQHIGRPSKNGV